MEESSKQQEQASRRIVTPTGTCSYPHLFEAWKGPQGNQPPKYGVTIVFPEGKAALDVPDRRGNTLRKAAMAAGEAKFGSKFAEGVRAGKIKLPFRDDGEEYPTGHIRLSARTDTPPQVVGRQLEPVTAEMQKAGDPNEVYAGSQVRVSLVAFGYDNNGNRGVSFALNNVQKVGEGTRIDSRRAPKDDFETALSEPPAALDDLI
jgi:hypothetical protein